MSSRITSCPPVRNFSARARKPDLSARGPYATVEDAQTARGLGITVRQLRQQRAMDDLAGLNARRRATKAEIIASLRDRMVAVGIKAVPLKERSPEYSYPDDGDFNEGDIGWLVIDGGEIFGLDEDMHIRLDHFTRDELFEIESNVNWQAGRARELDSEHDAKR